MSWSAVIQARDKDPEAFRLGLEVRWTQYEKQRFKNMQKV